MGPTPLPTYPPRGIRVNVVRLTTSYLFVCIFYFEKVLQTKSSDGQNNSLNVCESELSDDEYSDDLLIRGVSEHSGIRKTDV